MNRLEPYWLKDAAVRRLLAALSAAKVEARFVGGCVRDALLGIIGGDIDLATPARPEAVIAALKSAKIKALPTGLAHGTVTAIVAQPLPTDGSHWPPPSTGVFEITTLRRDIETDGRHAVVDFDAGWAEDAARRDFTINAIYLAPDGALYDPVGGRADLTARHVRFVRDPATRIAEDVLRVLRYYRFEARFGRGAGDAAARAACHAAVGELPKLSAERVWHELNRLLLAPDSIRVLEMMREDGVLPALLPEATSFDRLERLICLVAPTPTLPRQRGRERVRSTGGRLPPPPPAGKGRGEGSAAEPLLRLAALIEADEAGALALAERLRLSTAEKKRLAGLAKPWPLDPSGTAKEQRLALYRLGRERYRDLALLLAADGLLETARLHELLELPEISPIPTFQLGGGDVTGLGIPPGPRVGRLLSAVRQWWEEGDFAADRAACLARLREIAAQP